jgi:hypothetical protein
LLDYMLLKYAINLSNLITQTTKKQNVY